MSPSSQPPATDPVWLDRYIAGELSPAERRDAKLWLTAHPEWQSVIQRLRAMSLATDLSSARELSLPHDVDAEWNRLRSSFNTTPHRAKSKSTAVRTSTWAQRAGVGVAFLGMVAWGVYSWRASRPAFAERTYATRTAERVTVTLLDGTRVMLAPETRLTVASRGGDAGTRVRLVGEAYFDVTSSSKAPFFVSTGAVSTRVLGTAFTVRRYASDDTARIVVVSGKVSTRGQGQWVTVPAGSIARVTDSTATVIAGEDVQSYADWTSGRLVFKGVPIPEMLAAVGRWYGYQFRLTDSTLVAQSVSVIFKVSDPREMLTILQGTLGVDMSFDQNVITLTPRRDRASKSSAPMRGEFSKPSLEMGR